MNRLWILVLLLLLTGCQRRPLPPIPKMDFTVLPTLAMVYWVRPPHANISVLLNAMFNTPGDEGVVVYISGTYTVYSSIMPSRHSSLIGVPMVYFEGAVSSDGPLIEVK